MRFLTAFALSNATLVPFLILFALDGATLPTFALAEVCLTLATLMTADRPNSFARSFSHAFVKA